MIADLPSLRKNAYASEAPKSVPLRRRLSACLRRKAAAQLSGLRLAPFGPPGT